MIRSIPPHQPGDGDGCGPAALAALLGGTRLGWARLLKDATGKRRVTKGWAVGDVARIGGGKIQGRPERYRGNYDWTVTAFVKAFRPRAILYTRDHYIATEGGLVCCSAHREPVSVVRYPWRRRRVLGMIVLPPEVRR